MKRRNLVPPTIILIALVSAAVLFLTFRNTDTSSSDIEVINPSSFEGDIVSYDDSGFSPDFITVPLGTTVEFINNSGRSLWVNSAPHPDDGLDMEFNSRMGFGPGESYFYTFNKAGKWTYHNHLRPQDVSTVTVTSPN